MTTTWTARQRCLTPAERYAYAIARSLQGSRGPRAKMPPPSPETIREAVVELGMQFADILASVAPLLVTASGICGLCRAKDGHAPTCALAVASRGRIAAADLVLALGVEPAATDIEALRGALEEREGALADLERTMLHEQHARIAARREQAARTTVHDGKKVSLW